MEERKKVSCLIMFEMLGKPKEHLEATMDKFIETIGKEKGLRVINKSTNEAKILEQKDKDGKIISNDLYSTFSDLEIEFDDVFLMLGFAFKYMPSHLEIVKPEDFRFRNADFGSIVNNILTKMHHYDSIAKGAIMQNQILAQHLAAMKSKLEGNIPIIDNKQTAESKSSKKKVKKKI
jgi:hypothetical protein